MENTTIMQPKALTPPYLGIARLDNMLGYISGRNFTEVSTSLFIKNGFSNVDALLALNTLRFLGFVNEEGKATELMPKLRLSGEARKKEFEKIVKKAYEKIFTIVPAPQDLQPNELLTDFRMQYDLSERVAKAAVPVFMKLLEYSGLKEEGSIVGRVRQIKNKAGQPAVKNKDGLLPKKTATGIKQTEQPAVRLASIPVRLSDHLLVLSSPELNSLVNLDDDLNKKWRSALKELEAIANDIKAKEKSSPQEPE